MSDAVLDVHNVTLRFGGLTAVSDVSFTVGRGEMVGLIGPNGAGKTSLMKTIIGAIRPNEGRIVLDGIDISSMKTSRRSGLGLAMSHQIVRPFRNMSILDNVTLAAGRHITRSPLHSLFHVSRKRERTQAQDILTRLQIGNLGRMSPANQPLGVLKRLEVARALALQPSVLLLDEPLAGLGHGETGPIADLLAQLNQAGVTILLIEHNLVEARRICPRFIVLENGRKIADGATEEVLRDERVVSAYLGEGWSDA